MFKKKIEKIKTPELSQLEMELKRVENRRKFKKAVRSTIYGLITVAALAVLVATLWMPILRIYGNSMTPAVYDGEIVICIKNSNYKTGDIVGLYYGNKLLVKRVIAGPGDYVDFDYDGYVYVNNEKLEEDYLEDRAYGEISIDLPYQVPDKRFFVLGDHRSTSVDSRNYMVGAIGDDQIVGKIVYRIWPLKTLGRIR